MMRVLVTGIIPKEGVEKLKEKFDVTYTEGEFSREEVLSKLGEYDGVLLMGLKADKEFIDAGKKLKIIAVNGVGFDHVDLQYAKSKGIVVANVPNAVMEPTAEMAFTLMLATTRRILDYDNNMRKGKWLNVSERGNMGFSLYKSTLGIFGMGRIGKSVAKRAKAFGMEIIYSDPHRLSKEIEDKLGVKYVTFDEMLKKADVISVHAPLFESTRHSFSTEEFKKMKNTAFIVNTARGPLIDEKALIKALKEKEIAGAGLDVFEVEPLEKSELFNMPNVVLTPHAGTGCLSSRIAISEEATDNLISFLINNEEKNIVNK
ncbi:NAD(P)-dependent oxidoreductase [Paraclostridium bifermentans]|uniref:NAD(P)-dependent oxidoreductase n=1 Tax=Paraclostridium bifermentans TaxID=1490 RepID=UPI00242B6249|nr:NAD(P)-dependent oxidoreductase [Paraclostridium bifermentans]